MKLKKRQAKKTHAYSKQQTPTLNSHRRLNQTGKLFRPGEAGRLRGAIQTQRRCEGGDLRETTRPAASLTHSLRKKKRDTHKNPAMV